MISDPSIAIQRAVYAELTQHSLMIVAFSGSPQVFDRPPEKANLPWLIIGQDDVRDDSAEEMDGAEVTCTVHVYSDGDLSAAKRLAATAMRVLARPLDLAADGQRCVTALAEGSRHLADPDGKTWHSIVTVTYRTEPTA